MLLEYDQESGYDLPMVFDRVSVYQDIIHIDYHISFIDEVFEDDVHHGLEGGQTVSEAEEYDQGFEEAPIRLEGGFPLVSLLDVHIVISLMYIQFHKVFGLGVWTLVDKVWYEGQWVGVLHRHHRASGNLG